MKALDLYQGDHWSTLKRLANTASERGYHVRLWVVSAGYGLIPATASIFSYSATLVAGNPDSVIAQSGNRSQLREWWNRIASWSGPAVGMPRTIEGLVRSAPRSVVLLIVPLSYIDALQDDFERALEIPGAHARVILISASAKIPTSLRPQSLRFRSTLREKLGGTMHALGARVAEAALWGSEDITMAALQNTLDKIQEAPAEADLAEPAVRRRAHLSDEDLISWIIEQRRLNPRVAKTALLRQLRDTSQIACEQSRFSGLFASASSSFLTRQDRHKS